MTTSERIGAVVRRWRMEAGMTQQQLSAIVGRSNRGIRTVERGCAMVTLRESVRLCRALNKSLDQLVQEAEL